MENHNVSTSNILLEALDHDIPIAVTLSTSSRDIGIKNKDSAPTTPYNNQVPLDAELAALKSVVVEQFFLIKKSIKEIKDPNHEAANSTYAVMLMEQIEYLKEENKVKNSIIQSLTNQYNDIFNSTATSNNNNDNNIIIIIVIIITTIIYIEVMIIFLTPLTTTLMILLMIAIIFFLFLKAFLTTIIIIIIIIIVIVIITIHIKVIITFITPLTTIILIILQIMTIIASLVLKAHVIIKIKIIISLH